MNISRTERILMITLTNVGDAILSLPVLDALNRNFPEARIDVFLSEGVKGIFEKDRRVAKYFVYNKRAGVFEKYRLLKKLFKLKYDLIVDLKNTMIPVFLFPKARTSFIRGHTRQHKKEEHLFRLRSIGVDVSRADFGFYIDKNDYDGARALFSGVMKKGYIVVNPGAKSHLKRWPAEKFAGLCDRIVTELKMAVVFVGSDQGVKNPDSDRVVVNKVLKHMKEKSVDLVGKTNIRELGAVIQGAKAVVTNDSAPMHLASAIDTPTIAVFGPTDSSKYGPLASKSAVITFQVDCSPCGKAVCARDYECLKGVSIERVFNELKKLCGS